MLALLLAPDLNNTMPLVPNRQWYWQLARTCFHYRHQLAALLEPEAIPTQRLGAYVEYLWQLVVRLHPHYQLLAHNLPIRIEKRTLGEIDLLVGTSQQQTEHWELAFKYYLTVNRHKAVGPNPQDQLQIKLARLADHQLKLGQFAATQRQLQQQGYRLPTTVRQLSKGYCFSQLTALDNQEDDGWLLIDEVSKRQYQATGPWYKLKKNHWLQRQNHTDDLLKVDWSTMQAMVKERPTLITAFNPKTGTEKRRIWLVNSQWYQAAHS